MSKKEMINVLALAYLAGFHAAKMPEGGEDRAELAKEYAEKEVEAHYDPYDKYWV